MDVLQIIYEGICEPIVYMLMEWYNEWKTKARLKET